MKWVFLALMMVAVAVGCAPEKKVDSNKTPPPTYVMVPSIKEEKK